MFPVPEPLYSKVNLLLIVTLPEKEAEWLVSKNKVAVEPLLVLNFISKLFANKFKSPPVLLNDEFHLLYKETLLHSH